MKKQAFLSKQLSRAEMCTINGGQSYLREFCSGWCTTDLNCRNIAGAACRCHTFGCNWG